MTIKRNISTNEMNLINRIVLRAMEENPKASLDYTHTQMDLVAVHLNAVPLDLKKMLKASPFDLAHDVFGIARHLNRENGHLEDCFLPRCAQVQG